MDYRSIIESKYNRQKWQELLFDIFRNKVHFWQQPQRITADESMAKSAYYTGKIDLPDGHTIAVYEVELNDSVVIERNRAGIRNLLCSNWRGMGCSGAFMFCYRRNEAVLRFSYVSEAFTFAEDGSLRKDSTDTKRFTYLLGEGHRSRTAIQQFEKLKASDLTLKDITKAFSVEALSDLFFREYKKQYEDIIEFITGKRMVKVANKWEEQVTGQPCREIMREFSQFTDAEKAVRDYVKKLMGRLVFIQFLQKKGWMGCSAGEAWNDGDREFVQNLFAHTTHKNTFVDDVLEPLFADINTKRTGDIASNPNVGTGIKIPYLNGGLFEKDEYDKTNFPLPAKYMKNLLDFFASYNFTIDENDPDDAEIGVDPEMLGRIFENLLEDNKDKGAFYTPKEIVQYMCRESLIAYLQTDMEDDAVKSQIREFVTTHNAALLSADLAASIDQKLKDVKICDPAIGSGAFPMGLLRELYACRKALEGIDNDNAVRIKTHIIQQNIYGVDIEKGAVDIARLRFWLALIVDEKTPHALPNMDFKIMQGNSLLEQYEGIDLSGMTLDEQKKRRAKVGDAYQTSFAFDEKLALENIQKAIKQYYLTDSHDAKLSLRKIIDDNVKNYILNLKGCTPDIQRKLENLPIPNDQFFLWHIYFKEVFDKGGFDIVIGNPPYVGLSKVPHYQILLEKAYTEIHTGYNDLMYYFFYLGVNILSNRGLLSMITSNYFLGNEYAKKLRLFLSDKIESIINFNDFKVFESANVHTCISFTRKHSDNPSVNFYNKTSDFYKLNTEENFNLSCIERSKLKENWIIANDESSFIIDKIHVNSILLGEITNIEQGSKSGKNKIYTITKEYALLHNFEKELVRPNLKNGDISRYCIQDRGNLLIYTDNTTIIENYPNVLQYLLIHKDELSQRNEVAQGLYKWYRFDRPRRKSVFDAKEKIVVPYRSASNKFAYDDNQYFNDGGDIRAIVIKNNDYDIKYVLGLLNSKLLDWYYGFIGKVKGKVREYFNKPLELIPIHIAKEEEQLPIISLVDRILAAKKANPLADTTAEEREIDRLVYDLYNLTEEEINVIEST